MAASDDDSDADEVAKAALAEVQFLCEQRGDAVRSPELTEQDLRSFDRRLAGYVDAILSRGPQVLPWLLSMLAAAESPSEVCGIVLVLLESRDPGAAQQLLAAFETAEEGPKLAGLHMALRRGPIDLVVQPLQKWLATGSAGQAVAAAEALAFHRRLGQNSHRLKALCTGAQPGIRRAAWRAMALSM